MRRPVSFSKIHQSERSLRHWLSFGALTVAAFIILLLGQSDFTLITRARIGATDAVAPILEALSSASRFISRTVTILDETRDVNQQRAVIEEQNRRLREWQHIANGLAAENASLRRLSRLPIPPPTRFITARVISNTGGPFARSALLNAGQRDGVRRGNAVVSELGFVGLVVEVGEFHARILLLTDLNSQLPVVVQTTRDPGILSGDNSNRPRLLFLPQDAQISTGDPVVTSGSGGALPAGLHVGIITAVSETGVRVKPSVDWTRLDYVRVLDYQFTGILGSSGNPNDGLP